MYAALKAITNKERKVIKNGGKCGMNCAGIAYTTLYFSESAKSYYHHVADVDSCGGFVGTKNHSARFPYLFYHMYMMLLNLISNFVASNNFPFGIMTDKMTRQLTQHMVGICLPIWNVRSIYDVTELGVTNHFLEMLEAFGLDQSYQQQNFSGCAMDGQYIDLDVPDHLKNIFLKNFHVTWDPEQSIELATKDSTSNDKERQSFIEKVCETI